MRRLLVGGLLGVTVSAACLVDQAAAAPPVPAEIGGDHHSGTVVALAQQALGARDVLAVTGTPGAVSVYLRALNDTADAVAVEYGVDPLVVRDVFGRADFDHQTAVLAALSQLGVAYQSNRSSPGVAFDCSGLTSFAWARAGYSIAHQSSAQISAAQSRDEGTALAGDLVQYPGHVMMSLGFGRAIVHAANPGTDVELSQLRDGRSYRFGDPS